MYKDVEAAMAAAEVYREIYMDLRRKCIEREQKDEADLVQRLMGATIEEMESSSRASWN